MKDSLVEKIQQALSEEKNKAEIMKDSLAEKIQQALSNTEEKTKRFIDILEAELTHAPIFIYGKQINANEDINFLELYCNKEIISDCLNENKCNPYYDKLDDNVIFFSNIFKKIFDSYIARVFTDNLNVEVSNYHLTHFLNIFKELQRREILENGTIVDISSNEFIDLYLHLYQNIALDYFIEGYCDINKFLAIKFMRQLVLLYLGDERKEYYGHMMSSISRKHMSNIFEKRNISKTDVIISINLKVNTDKILADMQDDEESSTTVDSNDDNKVKSGLQLNSLTIGLFFDVFNLIILIIIVYTLLR